MRIKINNFFQRLFKRLFKTAYRNWQTTIFFQNINGADHARDLICDVKAMEGRVNVD